MFSSTWSFLSVISRSLPAHSTTGSRSGSAAPVRHKKTSKYLDTFGYLYVYASGRLVYLYYN